ncbi:5'-3' exonuclease [Subtercola sp. YIM 133946]|uniref:5'-3' exonuclease n=1 Tax=Subtercola sp. YIM 133946 TaxID=3118909 RepID=UPI002F946DE9
MAGRLMLLDTASLYFRAFYGVPDTVKAPDGTPVNAVRGLLDMIGRLVTDFEPTSVVACWDDAWRPQWRTALIPSYKLHRVAEEVPGGVDVEETPPALVQQIPLIREVLQAFGIPIVGAHDHEADDVIGTLATRSNDPVDVITGDRDLFQLADDERGVRIVYTARGMSRLELVTDEVVRSKYGVGAAQYVDFAVLRGDTSDGLPGVAGVGEKTAATLVRDFGSVEAIVAAAADRSTPMSASLRAKISAASDYLAVAPRVVEVVRDLPFDDAAIASSGLLEPVTPQQRSEIERLAKQWGLGGSVDRALRALPAAE